MKQSLGRKSILFLSQQLHSLTISDPAQYTVRLFILLRKKKKSGVTSLHYRNTILLINKVVKQFRFVVVVKDICINTAVTSYSIKNYFVHYAVVLTINA